MILDKLLINNLSSIGSNIMIDCGLDDIPQNIDEMNLFLTSMKKSIESCDFKGVLLGNILFSFVSCEEVRDRNVTSRFFEDLFSGLFGEKCSDSSTRTNPPVPKSIQDLDVLCLNENWEISSDLSGNKREKSDLFLRNYNISLKTLKGLYYDSNDNLVKKRLVNDKEENLKENPELNVGSLSYRALLKGILSDEHMKTLTDRKGGLGSKKQMMEYVLNPIVESNKLDDFKERLSLFFDYIYNDDVYIVLKSNYRISFHLIPRDSFINSMLYMLNKDIDKFAQIFYRWENNNLRLNWKKLIKAMDEFKLPYYSITIKLKDSVNDESFNSIKNNVNSFLDDYIKDNLSIKA